jgi:predicted PurR-regulated permease PerM
MSFPAPTEKQARVFWFSVTALAVAVLLALVGALLWAGGWVLNKLSPVLLPLAVAVIIAYLLDPVVDFIERRGIPRARAILLVFFLAVMLVLILLATVVPQLIVETDDLVDRAPELASSLRAKLSDWLAQSTLGMKAKAAWDSQAGETVQGWLTGLVPAVSQWLFARLAAVASWVGYALGLALVPVYSFYFLLEKEGIQGRWKDYVPVNDPKLKEEVIFVVSAINDCLIVFFRGQVLVALCSGTLLTIGFLLLKIPYAVVLGVMAGLLGIVPYLGVMISLVPALALAALSSGNVWGPMLVLGLFALVQFLEGFFYSPRIIGQRVGLHPLAIIIAVMAGTTLLGGILGGVLAIPLTAALRTLMFRYVWRREK